MLFADGGADVGWIGIGSVIGIVIGALATAWIKVTAAHAAGVRERDRTAVADYQKLLDLSEAARAASDNAREKMIAELNAANLEILRLKASVGDKDTLIARLRGGKPDA